MKFTRDLRTLTAFGLVIVLCACAGCSAFSVSKKKNRENAFPDRTPASLSKRSNESIVQTSAQSADAAPEATAEQRGMSSADVSQASVRQESDTLLELSVTSAIATALSNNLHLRVISNLPEQNGRQADIERAQYDPTLNANVQYLQGVQQVASALQAVQGGQSQYGTTSFGPAAGNPNLMLLEQRFSTGTTARIGVGSNYNLTSPIGQYLIYNPAFQTAGSLVIEQALFRGGSQRANLAGIHIAEASQKQSAAEFQIEVNETLYQVQRAYWSAWLAESQLKTHQEFVEQAQATYDLEKKRFELGEGGVVQSAEATEHLYSLKAGLAQAQQQFQASRNQLFSLIGIAPDDRRTLKLADLPVAQQVILDLDQGLSIATQVRPEMQVRQFQITQAQLEMDRRKNNQLPDVRAYAGYSLTGLNNSLFGSVNEFESGHFGTASVGVRYSYVFGQRAARAAMDQAQLALARQNRARHETEFIIKHQVRDAFDTVNSSWEVLRCQRERVAAARVQSDTFRHLHAAGQIDFDRLLRTRQQLSTVLQQAQSALIDYNMALNSWQLAIGTMTSGPAASVETRDADSIETLVPPAPSTEATEPSPKRPQSEPPRPIPPLEVDPE